MGQAASPTTQQPQVKLVLIGLRGSGKSTVARQLARKCLVPWMDLDDFTPGEAGCKTVADAWERHGEAGFRAAEARALEKALAGERMILALGGGTPTAPGAEAMIRAALDSGRARVAYLRCTPQRLRERLGSKRGGPGPSRPSLTGQGVLDEIQEIYDRRDPLYCSLATRVIEEITNVDQAVRELEGWRSW